MDQKKSLASETKLQKLACTQCGGAIDIHGGHSVRSIICKYCHTCLDSKAEFAPLFRFVNLKRPFMPIKIGARANLRGVDYVVIGVLRYEQREDDEVYPWLEYLMFSHTHGYVYLCYEGGHWVLMHEVKDLPESEVSLTMPVKSKFKVRNKTFKVFECAEAQLTYVEGELTWEAQQHEKSSYLDAIAPPYIYSIEGKANEIEYFWGEYIDHQEIDKAFDIKSKPPTTVFSCQPFKCSPIYQAVSQGAMLAGIIAIFLYIFISSSNGDFVTRLTFGPEIFDDGATSEEFVIDSTDLLYSLDLHLASLKNAWAFVDMRLLNATGTEEFFATTSEFSYYAGYEDGEHWTEGSRRASVYFKVPETGKFKLLVEAEGNSGETSEPDPAFAPCGITIELRKGVRLGHFTLTWCIFVLLIAAPYYYRVFNFEKARWEDEDD